MLHRGVKSTMKFIKNQPPESLVPHLNATVGLSEGKQTVTAFTQSNSNLLCNFFNNYLQKRKMQLFFTSLLLVLLLPFGLQASPFEKLYDWETWVLRNNPLLMVSPGWQGTFKQTGDLTHFFGRTIGSMALEDTMPPIGALIGPQGFIKIYHLHLYN